MISNGHAAEAIPLTLVGTIDPEYELAAQRWLLNLSVQVVPADPEAPGIRRALEILFGEDSP